MTEFHPPISERKTKELITIAHSSTEEWQQKAIELAKIELIKRGISKEEQDSVIDEWNVVINEQSRKERKKLEDNKTESYEVYEVIILLLFGPLLFIKPYFFNSHTLFTLRGENYLLKFRQRIFIFLFSFLGWFIYLNYFGSTYEDPIIEEMRKVDISEWEKEHGYK